MKKTKKVIEMIGTMLENVFLGVCRVVDVGIALWRMFFTYVAPFVCIAGLYILMNFATLMGS